MMRRAVSIQDIAQAAGVSHATVSRALRDNPLISVEVRGTIQRLASEMGYTPNAVAQSLKGQRSNTIGLVMTSIADPFYGRVARGVDEIARQAGLDVFLGVSYNNAEQELVGHRVISSPAGGWHPHRLIPPHQRSRRPTASLRGAGGDDQPAIRKRPYRVPICPGGQLRRHAPGHLALVGPGPHGHRLRWRYEPAAVQSAAARRATETPFRLRASRSKTVGSR